jgi:hypothetical protein
MASKGRNDVAIQVCLSAICPLCLMNIEFLDMLVPYDEIHNQFAKLTLRWQPGNGKGFKVWEMSVAKVLGRILYRDFAR